jgi:hypothetical protein
MLALGHADAIRGRLDDQLPTGIPDDDRITRRPLEIFQAHIAAHACSQTNDIAGLDAFDGGVRFPAIQGNGVVAATLGSSGVERDEGA